ncbi:MAG: pyruvate formate lyase family protein [Peptostreptococcaceae bacterium]
MNQNRRLFERELQFTNKYRAFYKGDKSILEAECLKVQIPNTLGKIEDKDLFAGRFLNTQIGIYPLMLGGGTSDGIDRTCYCVDFNNCYKILEQIKISTEYDDEYITEVSEAISFWEGKDTNTKVRNDFTDEMRKALTGDDYVHEIGAAYPLYRIAGAHLDYKKLTTYGLNGLIEIINSKINNTNEEKAINLYNSMIEVLNTLKDVCETYKIHTKEVMSDCKDEIRLKELATIYNSLNNIKENKPNTLHEAIQLINIYANASCATELGRIDTYLGDFYVNDIENNTITREEAIKYVDSFFNLIESNLCRDSRAIVGGFGRDNEKNADEFALITLEVVDKRMMSLPQLSLRYYKGMDERVYNRSLDVLGSGRTFPILYNDDVNVKSVMKAMDVDYETACQYGFFGCGEYMLASKSIGTPNTLINMPKILEVTLNNGIDPLTKKEIGLKTGEINDDLSFEQLFEMYKKQANYFVDNCGKFQELVYDKCNQESSFLLFSILYDDCIEKGRALFDGGLQHLGGTLETYGNITVADSFTAIKQIVYDRKEFALTQLVKMINKNFEGYDRERMMLINADKYGNDYDESDNISIMVHEHICNSIRNQRDKTRLDSLLVVMINNNMNILLGKSTGATPDGRLAKEGLSNGNGAYPGMDKEGITALMNSLVKLDTSIHAGANHNLKFSKHLFNENRDLMKILLQTYFDNGGQQTNISVVNQDELEDAIKNPEKHQNLVVRVGGFTAKFIDLDKETQLEMIKRTAY